MGRIFSLGTFTHTDGPRYLMVVNRLCQPTETPRTTAVTLDASGLNGSTYSYLVKDVYSRESVVTNDGASPSFSVDLAPGEGKLFRIEPWDDSVTLDGDVTIPTGVTLRLARGATVQFDANSDDTNPENDNDGTRSELIVAGTLNASAGEITFRSSNDDDDASRNDWYGITSRAVVAPTCRGATIRDASRCVQSHDLTGVTVSAATTFEALRSHGGAFPHPTPGGPPADGDAYRPGRNGHRRALAVAAPPE